MSKQGIREKLRIGKWKKEDYIVLALAGVLLLIIAMPVQSTSEKNSSTAGEETQGFSRESGVETELTADSYGEYWEKRLETALSQIEGVGKAKVMITLEDSGETIVEKDVPLQTSTTKEQDSGGGTRQIQDYSSTESTVFYTDAEGRQVPYVVRESAPKVTGVVVIAQGAGNAKVKEQITRLLEALFDVEAHKVIVVKMKTG